MEVHRDEVGRGQPDRGHGARDEGGRRVEGEQGGKGCGREEGFPGDAAGEGAAAAGAPGPGLARVRVAGRARLPAVRGARRDDAPRRVHQHQRRQKRLVLADREQGQGVPEAEEGRAEEVAGRVVEGGRGEGLEGGGVAQRRGEGQRGDDDEEADQKWSAMRPDHS